MTAPRNARPATGGADAPGSVPAPPRIRGDDPVGLAALPTDSTPGLRPRAAASGAHPTAAGPTAGPDRAARRSSRVLWPACREASEAVLDRCSTAAARWYVVPADRTGYRNRAVGRLLAEHVAALDPRLPRVEIDTERYRAQLSAS